MPCFLVKYASSESPASIQLHNAPNHLRPSQALPALILEGSIRLVRGHEYPSFISNLPSCPSYESTPRIACQANGPFQKNPPGIDTALPLPFQRNDQASLTLA